MKKRILVSLYLNKKSRSLKKTFGTAVHSKVTGSAFFPVTAEKTALLLALQAATNELDTANAATASGSHESFAAAEAAELQFDMAMRNMGYYVQARADADLDNAEAIILSAGMEVKKASVKMKSPHPIEAIKAKVTGDETSIKLYILTDNPRSTHIEILRTTSPDDPTSWVAIADITARRFLAEDLENGVRYYFKARAINSIGKSEYSDVVSQVAA